MVGHIKPQQLRRSQFYYPFGASVPEKVHLGSHQRHGKAVHRGCLFICCRAGVTQRYFMQRNRDAEV